MAPNLATLCSEFFLESDLLKGGEYFLLGKVEIEQIEAREVRGLVQGTELHKVLLDYSKVEGGIFRCACSCPRFRKGDLCKHIWATIVRVEVEQLVKVEPSIDLMLIKISLVEFDFLTSMNDEQGRKHLGEESANLSKQGKTKRPESTWRKQLSGIQNRLRDRVPDQPNPLEIIKASSYWFAISPADLELNGKFTVRIYESTLKKDGGWSVPRIKTAQSFKETHGWDLAAETVIESLTWDRSYFFPKRTEAQLSFSAPHLHRSLELLGETGRFVVTATATDWLQDYESLAVDLKDKWRLVVEVKAVNDEMATAVPRLERKTGADQVDSYKVSEVKGVCESGAVLIGNLIGILVEEDIGRLQAWLKSSDIIIPKSELPDFIERLVKSPVVSNLQFDSALGIEVEKGIPRPKLVMNSPVYKYDQILSAEISFRYGNEELSLESFRDYVWEPTKSKLIVRDRKLELKVLEALRPFGFELEYLGRFQKELSVKRKMLPAIVSTLIAAGWDIEAEGSRLRGAGDFNIKVTSGQDWFDVKADINFDGVKIGLPELLAAVRSGAKTIKLGDGTFGVLPEEWLKKFGGLEQLGEVIEDGIRLKSQQALLLDMMLAEQSNVTFDQMFIKVCHKLKSFAGIEPKHEPKSFQGTLRDYQRDGLAWFGFLREFKFGGCLADDMGLGKTIQVLALLEERRVRKLKKGEVRKPSIAIVPKSLIFNWIEEAKRFTPKLNVVDYTGKDRSNRWNEIEKADLVLTTYATFRLDVVELCQIEFDYAILDEAQAIKNASAQSSKAVRLLKADHRLAMSGTPVENHLGDLWTLFEFLNPGMLGNTVAKTFTFEDEDQARRIAALSQALKPFILRRTKDQVLTELPEKTEQTLYCEMNPKQKILYDQLKDHYRASLTSKIKVDGINKSKIQVLEALLRLRQASCDPRLIDPKQKVSGAKIELLVEQIEEALSEKHKALVFSQFTSLLALVRKAFDEKGWSYEYLDGQSNRRAESVKRFQEDPDCPLFLISLKAGGHGLNLTAADYVFILDPWWNPAVEAQAIDRAHRMGQKKSVVAYRVITKDTVEEKIVALQNSKRELADAIVSADEGLIRTLSFEDLQVLFE